VFTADRPALVTFFFTALFITVFETGRGVWALPVLSLVWANAHGGFFLGWIVCGAYAIDQRTKKRWAVTAACVLASSVNPNRLGVIETLLRYRQSYLTSTLIEWSRPHLWGPPYAFDILLYAAAVTLLISWRRVRIADWMLFAAFAAAALVAFRNMILIAFLAPILIGSYLPRPRFRAWAPYACAAAAAALAVLLLSRGRLFELRAAEWRYPAGAARFLDAHNVTAPLFNTYEYGGYLIWKGRRVFIDGRALSEAVYQRYLKALRTELGDRTLAATLGAYQIGAIVMNAFEYTSGALYPLALTLAGEPEWKLVYDDPQAMVFLRETPTGMQVIDKARILDHLERECALHIANDPEFPLCARTLADLFLRLGNRNRARNALALYLSHTREEDREARRAYRQLIRMR
jgi:hypothetical protein